MKKIKELDNFVLVGLLAITLTGCSVAMALHGKEDVDIAALHIGQPRAEVILLLGQPAKTITTETGRTDVFAVEKGNAPSAGRAIGHGAMDVLTLGLWEVIGTPVEGLSSSKQQITVKYDKEDKVTNLFAGAEEGGL